MLSRSTRVVLLVVFGFLLITSEFPDFSSRLKAGLRNTGNELAPETADSAAVPRGSIFVDAQWGYGRRGWGGGYGGGWGRRGWGGGYGGGWGRRGYGGGWGRRGGYWG